ncbi:MAG: DUF420 domain-containing protein [Pirellulales bacterium]|nr:DUF420 domain-containing protein [Pirellulales bacterium]
MAVGTEGAVAAPPAKFSGIDGFLGTRGSLMLDLVVIAMLLVLPVMLISIALVKYRRQYAIHKVLQLTLAVALLAAVAMFEVDIRVHGWRDRAEASPYSSASGTSPLDLALWVHLCFAVSAAVLWVAVTVRALRQFPSPIAPSAHSASHMFWARLAAFAMFMTAVTGWVFYWMAFVATR